MLEFTLTSRSFGHMARVLMLTSVGALAACGDEETKEATPAASATEAANANTAALSSNSNWLDLSSCGQPPTGTVNYLLGGTELSISQAIVRRVILPKTPENEKLDPQKPLATQVAPGTGCPDKPLPIVGVVTKSSFETDLLEGSVTMFPVAPGLVANYSKVVQDLRNKRPANSCQQEKDGLLVCFGQEKQGETTTDVAYVIVTDQSMNLNSGAPLFARCEIREGKPVGCNLGDLASSQVFYDATLARLPRSAADLRAAHQTVNKQFASQAG
ncbi:hypothetical protein KHP62_20355 [Rhodobacteraceae bacterium NNCM2]|nr:hypothetical protein [Coraliihabitans acroporae]